MTLPPVDELLCRWAEKKYETAQPVARVDFEMDAEEACSEWTPAGSPHIVVTLHFEGAVQTEHTYYDTDLIRDVLAFGLERQRKLNEKRT